MGLTESYRPKIEKKTNRGFGDKKRNKFKNPSLGDMGEDSSIHKI